MTLALEYLYAFFSLRHRQMRTRTFPAPWRSSASISCSFRRTRCNTCAGPTSFCGNSRRTRNMFRCWCLRRCMPLDRARRGRRRTPSLPGTSRSFINSCSLHARGIPGLAHRPTTTQLDEFVRHNPQTVSGIPVSRAWAAGSGRPGGLHRRRTQARFHQLHVCEGRCHPAAGSILGRPDPTAAAHLERWDAP